MIDSCGDYEKAWHYQGRFADFARQLERENAALVEALRAIVMMHDAHRPLPIPLARKALALARQV